jgi:hypothetical protein
MDLEPNFVRMGGTLLLMAGLVFDRPRLSVALPIPVSCALT